MIKNIIFDFGDIFINLDKTATAKQMKPFGFIGITPELDALFQAYEKGGVSTDDFLQQTQTLFPKAKRQDLIDAWNAILLDFPDSRLHFIEALTEEQTYRLFLLSNTNELHINFVKDSMGAEKFTRFKGCFEVFYLSHEMGKRKPDHNIFQQLLDENALQPQETLFVDDLKANTDSAAEMGMKVWNLQVGKEDVTQLKKWLHG